MTIKNYKVKLFEGEKSVKQEIELEGDNLEEISKESRRLYESLEGFCLAKSIKKLGGTK